MCEYCEKLSKKNGIVLNDFDIRKATLAKQIRILKIVWILLRTNPVSSNFLFIYLFISSFSLELFDGDQDPDLPIRWFE